MDKCRELSVDADIKSLSIVMEALESELDSCGCPLKISSKIGVCLEELFVNIADYAYDFSGGKCIIRIYTKNTESNGTVRIELEDWGKPFDPFSKEDPDITLSAEERGIGGLGIFMVKKIMDRVWYRRENDKNLVILEKEW